MPPQTERQTGYATALAIGSLMQADINAMIRTGQMPYPTGSIAINPSDCQAQQVTRSRTCTPNVVNPNNPPTLSPWDYQGRWGGTTRVGGGGLPG